MPDTLHRLLLDTASDHPGRVACRAGDEVATYEELSRTVEQIASSILCSGLARADRVAVWLDKRLETVISTFAVSLAGGVHVPINTTLRPEQVAYILHDCSVRGLITTADRWTSLQPFAASCVDLEWVVCVGTSEAATGVGPRPILWGDWLNAATALPRHRVIDTDLAAILYTSGSTGKPKGVVLSHRNIVAGAHSVASYLQNSVDDRILAVLPLSFDYGMSQLTTAFSVGATVVLHNYLLPADVIRAMVRHRITGLAAVPPLWIQLAALDWPASINDHLRYFTNSGGAMPTATLAALRARAPQAKPFLMYGLTEAFRSTYLPPEQVDRRPTSIGMAIPNVEVLVVREDGSECAIDEPGELVHRGALVALGYWNDPVKTAERFRPLPGQRPELVIPEVAVWSGDTVRKDSEGYLYFVSRRDEMIKTSGYRVSPTEVEEVLYRTGRVAEVAAFGVEHPALGQAIVVVAQPAEGHGMDADALVDACKLHLPHYMLPLRIDWLDSSLPRNANGKIDRKALAQARSSLFTDMKQR